MYAVWYPFYGKDWKACAFELAQVYGLCINVRHESGRFMKHLIFEVSGAPHRHERFDLFFTHFLRTKHIDHAFSRR